MISPLSANASTIIVRSNDMVGWTVENQDLNTAHGAPTGRFVSGPSLAPSGYGSFQQRARQGDKQALTTILHNGMLVSDLTALRFSTYSTSTGPTVLTASMKLDIDKDGNGTVDTTLVYEPYEQASFGTGPSAVANAWQTWDTAAGSWWSTKAPDGVSGSRKSLAAWNAAFGGASSIAQLSPGGVRLEVGSTGAAWADFVGGIDRLVVDETVYDFEPIVVTNAARAGWEFQHQDLNTSDPAPTTTFENGPSGVTAGYGSIRQSVSQGDKAALITQNHNGAALESIDTLSYETYVTTSSSPVLPANLKLDVDKDGNGTVDTTLVYEPYEQSSSGTGASTQANVWQTWDALAGSWWSTKDGGVSGPRQSLATWTSTFGSPTIATLTQSGVRVEAGATGATWPNHIGSIDNVAIGLATYDFETLTPSAPIIQTPAHGSFTNSTIIAVQGLGLARGTVTVSEGVTVLGTAPVDQAGAWTLSKTFSAGSHTITAKVTDQSGNQGPASAPRTFTVDTAAPGAPVFGSPTYGGTVLSNNVSFGGSAEPGSTVVIREAAAVVTSTTTNAQGGWAATASLATGGHSVTATATDSAGNTSAASAAWIFTVDPNVPATPVIQSPSSGAAYRTGSILVSGTARPGWTVELKEGAVVIGTALAGPSGAWSVSTPFTDGTHTITATANDGGPISAPTSGRTFTVDSVVPVSPVVDSPSDSARLTTKSVTFAGTAEPNSTVIVKEGSATRGSVRASGTGTWSVTGSFNDGAHTVRVVARDTAGNESAPVLRSFSNDTVKPVMAITSRNPSVFAPGQPVRIAGSASDAQGVDRVEVSFTDAVSGDLVETVIAVLTPSGTGFSWVAEPVSVSPGAYDVAVVATDLHGHTASGAIRVLTLN